MNRLPGQRNGWISGLLVRIIGGFFGNIIATLTADRTWTFQDSTGTVPLLEAAQTFTAQNTMSGAARPLTLTRSDVSGTDQEVLRLTTASGGMFTVRADDLSLANPAWQIATGGSEPLSFYVGSSEVFRATGTSLVIGYTATIQFAASTTARHLTVGTTTSTAAIACARYSANSTECSFVGAKNRNGTPGSHTILNNGDSIVSYRGDGSDGAAYFTAASFRILVDAAPSTGIIPGRASIWTANAAGTEAESLRSDSAQGVTTFAARYLHKRSVAASAGTTVLDATDHFCILTGATTHTFTLPAASDGRELRIKNRSSGTLTINRAGSDTIDGGTTTSVTTGLWCHLVANGTDWCIFS